MTDIRNTARERLAKGELALGMGVRIVRGVEIASAMQSCGYDWLFIDLEHGTMSIENAAQIAAAALDAGIAPLVRVPNRQYDMATRMLDGGAWGIVMPHVDTAEEAAECVARLKYPPQGHRSVAGGLAHFGYRAVKIGDASRIINDNMLLTVMLETPQAIANAEAIAAVPGVDVLLIGTNDLATEMGIPGELAEPRIVAAYETVIAACKRHGKWPGMGGVYGEELLRRYIGMGMRMILCGNDLSLIMGAAAQRAGALRGS
jgi:2-keto-3-deoxy-L-rhamnonate aldolase RhmA